MKRSRVTEFIIKHKARYLKGLVFLIIINVLQLVVPKITGRVIDLLQENAIDGKGLTMYCGIILVIALLVFVSHYLSRIQILGASNLFDYRVRNAMFKHLLDLSMKFYQKNGVGNIMALATNDLSAVRMAMSRGMMLIVNTLILLVSSLVIMGGTVNLRLTMLAFIPFPFLIIIMVRFGPVINRRFKGVQESFGNLTRKVQENISGIRVVKAFVQEENEIENFEKINNENFHINMRLVRIWGMFFPLITMVASLSYLLVLVYGGSLVVKREISLGDFIAFNSYIGLIVRPIGFIGMLINFIQRGKASLERIENLFNQKPEVTDETVNPHEGNSSDFACRNGQAANKLKGKIEFCDLTFRYEKGQKPVLKNINLTIEPGKTVGIIGKIGSGKSTLANLVLRLYNPETKGQLLIDGRDITEIPLKLLRDSIGYVPQDNFLFSAPIKDNIAFVPQEVSMDEVELAADISQVHDAIMEFPDKYDTQLGERGVNLSGGQKQRISIARAIVKDPSILILDDCLSAVDTKTEERILNGLKPFMKGRTCMIIAHRISTIKDADEIVVMDQGEIVERGNHQELLDRKGLYYRIYQRQLLEEQIESA